MPSSTPCAVLAGLVAGAMASASHHPTVIKTVYRITPRNYTGVTNLDTGDAGGDAFFGLYELQAPVECTGTVTRQSGLLCKNEPILQIPGFNVYEQFHIEMDQRTGDYAECNPSSDPPHEFGCTHFNHGQSCWYNDKDHPEWKTEFAGVCSARECTCDAVEEQAVGAESVGVTFGHFNNNNASYPAQCKASHFNQFMHYEPKGIPLGRATTTTEGGCCNLCDKFGKLCKGYGYTYSTSKCQLYTLIVGFNPTPGGSLGYIDTSGTNFTRELGKQTTALAQSLNGTWYSTQAAGECKPGQAVGDGCYWRVVNMSSNVNATCVNGNLIQTAIDYNPACWQACPQPTNATSNCYIKCLFDTVAGNTDEGVKKMPPALLISSFEQSFESSAPHGCPQVPPCPSPCHPPAGWGAGNATANAVFSTR